MSLSTLIKTATIDGEELVCVAPWLWDMLIKNLEALAKECEVE